MKRIISLALSLTIGVLSCIYTSHPVESKAQATVLGKKTALTANTAVLTTITIDEFLPIAAHEAEAEASIISTAKDEETQTAAEEETTQAQTEKSEEPSTEAKTVKTKNSGEFFWPADPDAIITAGYPYYSDGSCHNGVDIALYDENGGNVSENTYIHAALDGKVITVFNDGGWNTGFGNYCIIDHGNGIQTLYAHSNNITVSEGERVKRGQIIGLVGSTGNTTANHLHFEVRVATGGGYERVNPLKYISEP